MYIIFWYLIPKSSSQRLRIIQSIKSILTENFLSFNRGLGFLLEKSFLTMLIATTQRTKNVDHHLGLTHNASKWSTHLSTQSSQDLESISLVVLGAWVFPIDSILVEKTTPMVRLAHNNCTSTQSLQLRTIKINHKDSMYNRLRNWNAQFHYRLWTIKKFKTTRIMD